MAVQIVSPEALKPRLVRINGAVNYIIGTPDPVDPLEEAFLLGFDTAMVVVELKRIVSRGLDLGLEIPITI